MKPFSNIIKYGPIVTISVMTAYGIFYSGMVAGFIAKEIGLCENMVWSTVIKASPAFAIGCLGISVALLVGLKNRIISCAFSITALTIYGTFCFYPFANDGMCLHDSGEVNLTVLFTSAGAPVLVGAVISILSWIAVYVNQQTHDTIPHNTIRDDA